MVMKLDNESSYTVYSLSYLALSVAMLTGASSLRALGLSADHLALWMWPNISEDRHFLHFYARKTSIQLLVDASIPFGYFVGLIWVHMARHEWHWASVSSNSSLFTQNLFLLPLITSFIMALAVFIRVFAWTRNEWGSHPYTVALHKFASLANNEDDLNIDSNQNENNVNNDEDSNNGNSNDNNNGGEERSCEQLINAINTEFRSVDKFACRPSAFSLLVVTEHYLVLIGRYPWQIRLARQSDIRLRLIQSDHHALSLNGQLGGAQFLSILVQDVAQNAEFEFRLSSLELQNLQDKLSRPIENESEIRVFKTISERFVDAFVAQVLDQPRVRVRAEEDSCVGCMEKAANVKLIRRCHNRHATHNPCVDCNCRPMWCIDCMAKWFVSRQDQSRPETWMQSTCPCPSCRSRFCVVDVAIAEFHE